MSNKFAGMNMEVPSLKKKVKGCIAVTIISLPFKISFQLTKGGKFERISIGILTVTIRQLTSYISPGINLGSSEFVVNMP